MHYLPDKWNSWRLIFWKAFVANCLIPTFFDILLCLNLPLVTLKINTWRVIGGKAVLVIKFTIVYFSTNLRWWVIKYLVVPTICKSNITSIVIRHHIGAFMLRLSCYQMRCAIFNLILFCSLFFFWNYDLSFLCNLPQKSNTFWLTYWSALITYHFWPTFRHAPLRHQSPIWLLNLNKILGKRSQAITLKDATAPDRSTLINHRIGEDSIGPSFWQSNFSLWRVRND